MTLSEQLKSLVERATPGPWRFETDVSHFDSAAVVARDGFIGANYYRRNADALLVVALLNNLPTILAALEAVDRMGSFGCAPNHNTTKPIKAFGVSLGPTPEVK